MASTNQLLVFPDNHADLAGAMHALNVQSKANAELRALLSESSKIIKDCLTETTSSEESAFRGFEHVTGLAERNRDQTKDCATADMVLLTTVQVGQLLALWQKKSDSELSIVAIGYGVGLFAASVAATASNTAEVVLLGLRAIAVVFRLGLQLERIGSAIEVTNGNWAHLASGHDSNAIQKHLDTLNDKLSPLQRAYIGQVFHGHVVIHGPPRTLSVLTSQTGLARTISETSSPYKCPLYGRHLPHVDTAYVVGKASAADAFVMQQPMYSAHTPGESISMHRFGQLLPRIVAEVCHKPVQMLELVKTMAGNVQKAGSSDFDLKTLDSSLDFSSIGLDSGNDEHVEDIRIDDQSSNDGAEALAEDSIAVVGMSGRFPDSDSLEELWDLLRAGKTTHQKVPTDRFSVDDFYDLSREKHNAILASHGCFLKNPGDFDHRLFNISPREALQMDPVQRMLLMTTYEALEMAGYSQSESGDQAPPNIATFFGQTVDDWKTINMQQGIDTHFLPAVNRGFAPGRLCHYFRWAGGFYSIDTGCSSSATGICIARDALIAGTCDAAIVGGGTLLSSPEWFAGLSQGGFLSPTGACKTYSETADGYCRGEGVAVVVLKRLKDAIRSKDNILAVVAGAARNTNAGEGSITHPGQHAQENLVRRVLRQAAVRPEEVEVVEMHGTGTQAGDRVETTAVHNVFVTGVPRSKPLIVGAIKAALGHSEAAAGVVSLIKAILMLQHGTVPAQPGQPIAMNPYLIPLFNAGIELGNGQAWPRKASKTIRSVFINNFDAAGGNVSMLIQDPPIIATHSLPKTADARSHHIVTISGRTPAALAANKDRLRHYLTRHSETHLASLAYTSTARRMHHNLREAYVGVSIHDILRQLERPLSAPSTLPPASNIVFAFTGQGSSYVGMGSQLYKTSPTFRRLLDSCQDLCDAQGLECDLLSVIRESDKGIATDVATAEKDMQIGIVALEIALAQYWQLLGLQPSLAIGHSLGEFAALCIAGVLSLSDTLVLVHKRATLITTRNPASEAAMLAVALPLSTAHWRIRASAVTSQCEVCCINGPNSTVIGGPIAAIQALESNLQGEGIRTTLLPIKYAFHTRQMDCFLDELETTASYVHFQPPKIPVASTVLGRIVKAGEESVFNASYIRQHTRDPVQFQDAVLACKSAGLIRENSFIVEIGPHPICLGLIATALENLSLYSFASLHRKRDDWETISICAAGAYQAQLPISWTAFHQDHLSSLQLLADAPTYGFDKTKFWHTFKTEVSQNSTTQAGSASPASRLLYASLQTLQQLRKDGSKLHATFATDTAEPVLRQAIAGHVVDGVAICPASVFIDMAYSAAQHLEAESQGGSKSPVSAYNMTDLKMQNPLVIRESDEICPLVLVEATLDSSTRTVTVAFKSSKVPSTTSIEHGSCSLLLPSSGSPKPQTWSQMKALVGARMNTLLAAARPREAYAFDRKLFYKSFSEIVDYGSQYHAVTEAVIATDFSDAAFILQNPTVVQQGPSFACNPFAVDAFVHIAGYLLNADVHKPKDEIHIANHIGALQVYGKLALDEPCRGYATIRERNEQSGTSLCDVYVIDNSNQLLAMCTDICFKRLDRDFFSLLTGSDIRRNKQRSSTNGSSTPSDTSNSSGSELPGTPDSEADDLLDQLLSAVSVRSGISIGEIQKVPEMSFADMGLDSQMSIQVLSDFRKSTAVELPAAFFSNFPTPAAVAKELSAASSEDDNYEHKRVAPPAKVKTRAVKQSPASQRPSEKLLGLVVNSLGLEASGLTPSTTFSSLGMDSMLSIKIIAKFQKDTGIEIPAAFFTDCPTVGAMQAELDGQDEEEPAVTSQAEQPVAPNLASHRQQTLDNAVSRPVLIQGKSRSRDAPLFMTTDGSGTVESYIHLSALPKGRRIYALESPFLQSKEYLDFKIPEMASIFIRSIRKVQPRGPYLIGGWSAGSMYAYEVAHRLSLEGETIQALVILDMRAPSLIPTTIVTPEFVDKLGTFEGINRARDLPQDLSDQEKKHLMATCRALSQYDAPKFPRDRQPQHTTVVWAREGLDNRADAPKAAMHRPEVDMGKPLTQITLDEYERYFNSWFYGKREDFGTNGWEDFVGENISVHEVDGDHFSMMVPPLASAVGKIVADAVQEACGE